jgi:beta-lactamase regulating signal transducer with metallopeptidase domain
MTFFISSLIETSLVMSAIIILFTLVNLLLSARYPSRWRYYTWIIIIFGLLIPIKPVFKIPALFPWEIGMEEYNRSITTLGFDNAGADMNGYNSVTVDVLNTNSFFTVSNILFFIWIIGTAGILIYHIARYRRFITTVWRWSEEVQDAALLNAYRQVVGELNVKARVPALRSCRLITTPLLTGFTKPAILLPESDTADDELTFILKHELTHYVRKDLWVRVLILISNAIHWFNPLVHICSRETYSACEDSCDEAIIGVSDFESRKSYGEVIIGIIGKKNRMTSVFSTYFSGGKRNMKRRLFLIMDSKHKSRRIAVLCMTTVFLAIILSSSACGNGNNAANPQVNKDIVDSSESPAASDNKTASAGNIGEEKAKEIALERAGGGELLRCIPDYEDGVRVYDVVVTNGNTKYDMDIATADGTILQYEEEIIDGTSSQNPANAQAPSPERTAKANGSITSDEAIEIALGSTGGGTVTKCELDYEFGKEIYEIEIQNGIYEYEINVAAADGSVLKTDREVND